MRLSLRQQAAMQGAFLEESVIEQVAKLELAIGALKAAVDLKAAPIDFSPLTAGLNQVKDAIAAIEIPAMPEIPNLDPVMTRLGKVEVAITASAKRPKYTFDIERNASDHIVKVIATPQKG